jgi:two-component system OmpR family response regulator
VKILVVDDEEQVLNLVATLLEAKDHEAITASDGEEALSVVDANRPDAIFLDIMMPGVDGATVAQRLREAPDTADIPIIFLTGLVDADEMRKRGPKIGGQYFLAKPFDAERLFQVLELATR